MHTPHTYTISVSIAMVHLNTPLIPQQQVSTEYIHTLLLEMTSYRFYCSILHQPMYLAYCYSSLKAAELLVQPRSYEFFAALSVLLKS